jgi:hypothetical protein
MANRSQFKLGKHQVPIDFGVSWNGLEKFLCPVLSVGFGNVP